MKKKYPAKYTIALYDVIELYPNILDILDSNEMFKNNNLKERFLSYWGIYEISAETIELFKIFLERTYNEYAPIFLKYLEIYINKIQYLQPIQIKITKDLTNTDGGTITKQYNNTINRDGTETTIDYELPNKNTNLEYPNNKEVFTPNVESRKTGTDTDTKNITKKDTGTIIEEKSFNVIEQTEKYYKFIRDIIQNFILKFENCFLWIM